MGAALIAAGRAQCRWCERQSQECQGTCACRVLICFIGVQLKGLIGPGVNRR